MTPIEAAEAALPERDTAKPAEQQGLFRKFTVTRTDGSSEPGGKHHGCEYFVLDVDHDPHAAAALAAYADAVEPTHPLLAADMRKRYGLAALRAALPALREVEPVAWAGDPSVQDYTSTQPEPLARLTFDQIQRCIERHAGGAEWTDEQVDSAEAFARIVESEVLATIAAAPPAPAQPAQGGGVVEALGQARSALQKTMGVWGGTCAWHADVKAAIAAIDAARKEPT